MNTTTADLDANDFIGGIYIKKQDLDAGPQRFTIAGVSRATFASRDGRPAEDVLQLEFPDGRKFSLSAKTNVRILIKALWSEDDRVDRSGDRPLHRRQRDLRRQSHRRRPHSDSER